MSCHAFIIFREFTVKTLHATISRYIPFNSGSWSLNGRFSVLLLPRKRSTLGNHLVFSLPIHDYFSRSNTNFSLASPRAVLFYYAYNIRWCRRKFDRKKKHRVLTPVKIRLFLNTSTIQSNYITYNVFD